MKSKAQVDVPRVRVGVVVIGFPKNTNIKPTWVIPDSPMAKCLRKMLNQGRGLQKKGPIHRSILSQ